ncbi:glucosaminidase domain-containing protein [Chryseobacterium bernardetii]|uniref:glucosaminidase domain-containing protein n=1 Tax=Chryseobacterium bernardetii TaxID=1241978 RepID=UPI003AF5159D
MGKLTIIGNDKPVIGKQEMYSVAAINGWLNPLQPIKNPLQVPQAHWEVMVQTKTGWRKGGSDKEGQVVPYMFGQKSLLHKGIKIVVQQGNDKGELIVHPQRAKEPKITRVELLDANYKPIPKGKKLSYKDTIIARAYCVEMFGMNIAFTLWEDDAQGEGHNPTVNALNKINPVPVLSRVNEKGMAEAVFRLPFYTMAVLIANAHTASGDKSEGATHEYYVTADVVSKHIQKASPNVNVVNPTHNPEPPRKREVPKGHTPSPAKPKTTPALEKPKPKPDGNSAKFPVTTGGKKSDDPQGKILSAEFVDKAGNRLHSSKVGTTVRIKIVAKEMKGKKVKVKIWEEDNIKWTHDMIFENDCILIGDNNYLNNVQLTKQMFDKANDGGSDSAKQDYFIEVIHNDTSVKSVVMPVSVDAEPTRVESGDSATAVKKTKLKFDKVVGLGKEAILHITSEIATEITVDKNGKITSYPDYGGYNGMNEYKEGNKIYTKKLANGKSAFPLYKMYIYRGNKTGEAVQKLKQDIENKTHENAETTVLTVARHAQTNNKNYGSEGPLPPNTITTLYRIRYMQAWNHAKKESFRYRIVSDNTSNMKPLNDTKKEVSSGAMSLGNRGSISIDPWSSAGLIGCIGIRNSDGKVHSSCEKEYPNQDKENYKFIYHALNNYLETIIPELTGVYGRRGYSSNGKVAVVASRYEEEVKVFVLTDLLPELNNCKLNLKKDGREKFYDEFGESAIKMVENQKKSNKFKGLYIIAQRRQENGLSLTVPNNNPMNIKDSGDLGKSDLYTKEVFNGKEVYINDGFGKFSSVEKGFEGYLKLLNRNFNDAYTAILDDSKTIDDFLSGMQDTGKKGAYATDPNYKTSIKGIFNGVVKDYKEILNYRLCKEKLEEGKNKIKKDIELLNKLK